MPPGRSGVTDDGTSDKKNSSMSRTSGGGGNDCGVGVAAGVVSAVTTGTTGADILYADFHANDMAVLDAVAKGALRDAYRSVGRKSTKQSAPKSQIQSFPG